MGSSGSGKTTFLSALAKRLDMNVSGDIRLNGREYSRRDLKNMSGYVMQDDLVNANFTVAETLSYTAELRMPANTSYEERKSRETYVMKLMGIYHCRDVKVGDTRNKGISGGAADQVLPFFERFGFPCPPMTNPADHIIHVLSLTKNGPQRSKVEVFEVQESEKFIVTVDLDAGSDKPPFPPRESPPWSSQLWILLRRSLLAHLRRWDIIAMNLTVTVIVAIFTCMSVWEDIGTHKTSGAKRQAALFFCVIHQGIVASLQGSHSFPLERALMLRERAAGTYNISAYFLAKTIADMATQLASPIIFTCIVYPIIGFAPTARQFFVFMGFMVLDSSAATSLTSMISCLCVGIEMSTVVAAGAYEITRLYGGWFISPAQISLYPDWRFADVLSYIKYSFVGVSLNENMHLLLTCLPSEMTTTTVAGVTTSKCVIAPLNKAPYSGDAYNAFYGYDNYTMGFCAGILVVLIVGCRLVAYLGLRFIKV
eukprot:gene31371-38750_t